MCEQEKVQTLQRGMNFRLNKNYSVILMSQRKNAPYKDEIEADGVTIRYEGHDIPRKRDIDPKKYDQREFTERGRRTQNGYFTHAVEVYKKGEQSAEPVRVYEKLMSGVWSLKGIFSLVDFFQETKNKRKVFTFILRLSDECQIGEAREDIHTRVIPTEIKKEVWKRDGGKCVLCNAEKNLHFDHEIPFAKGGTSLLKENIRILCFKCNIAKSAKIE